MHNVYFSKSYFARFGKIIGDIIMARFDGGGFLRFIFNFICFVVYVGLYVLALKGDLLLCVWILCGGIGYIRNRIKGVKGFTFLQLGGGIITLLVSFFIH